MDIESASGGRQKIDVKTTKQSGLAGALAFGILGAQFMILLSPAIIAGLLVAPVTGTGAIFGTEALPITAIGATYVIDIVTTEAQKTINSQIVAKEIKTQYKQNLSKNRRTFWAQYSEYFWFF